jgi:hypothetical protein
MKFLAVAALAGLALAAPQQSRQGKGAKSSGKSSGGSGSKSNGGSTYNLSGCAAGILIVARGSTERGNTVRFILHTPSDRERKENN